MLERVLDVNADVVAVARYVILASTRIGSVSNLAFETAQIASTQTQGIGLTTFDKVAGLAGVTFEVALINCIRRQVYTGVYVVPGAIQQQRIAVGVLVYLAIAISVIYI